MFREKLVIFVLMALISAIILKTLLQIKVSNPESLGTWHVVEQQTCPAHDGFKCFPSANNDLFSIKKHRFKKKKSTGL